MFTLPPPSSCEVVYASERELLLQHKILLDLQERREQNLEVVKKKQERGNEKSKLRGWNNPCFVAATMKQQQQ